jgi:nucleotide-binding universal stress UspA family protein
MEKKILLAVDDSVHAKNAVQYAVKMASQVNDLTFSLLHVQPAISQYLLEEAEKNLKAKAELKNLVRKNTEASQHILEKHKADMVRTGISESCIETTTQPRALGIAKDVMDRGQQGLYDAIVVGRRGLSRIQKAFMGSLTADLVEHSKVVPVWIVDGPVTSSKVMLAIDGSESSLRAVDHLSFMVGGNPDVHITLFHVTPRLVDYCVVDFSNKESDMEKIVTQGDRRCIDDFYALAQKNMERAGIEEAQFDIKVVKRNMNVGKAVVDEAKKGKYGTVVVGRRGAGQSFFTGSVSRVVIDKTVERALWLVN